MRICILSNVNTPQGFLDNDVPKALHFYNDTLTTYLSGSANTFVFSVDAKHSDSALLEVGVKLSFVLDGKPYYMTVMEVVEDETEKEITAHSWSFELLNEIAPAYAAESAMSFVEYIEAFNFEDNLLTIGINEVSDKAITNEWTGSSDSVLSRLYSLANVFEAEIEFIPRLNNDYSLDTIILNVYRAHSDDAQGIGTYRDDVILRYGVEIEGITKEESITELYTSIQPTGRDEDGETITIEALERTVYNDAGEIEYFTPAGDGCIYAPLARDMFPSNVNLESDRYIKYIWETQYTTTETLYGNALAKLKTLCVPNVEYTIKGYMDLNIGDTVRIVNEAFNPTLYLEARVTEQKISITEPARSQTTFSNVAELDSEIEEILLSRMQSLIEETQATAETVQVLTSQVVTLSEAEANTSAAVQELNSQVETLNSQVDTLSEAEANTAGTVQELSTQVETLKETSENTSGTVQELSSQVEELTAAVAELQAMMGGG